jgi:hypothetical protein
MGKVETHHIQAGFHHAIQRFGIGTGGAEGGDDFGSANHYVGGTLRNKGGIGKPEGKLKASPRVLP